jgi:protein-disulfide isomerase-like protein with CxxC motif
VAREFPDVEVMTVVSAIGQSPGPDPASFMADNALTFPTVVDDEATTILRGLGIQGFPTVFYVASDGRVVRVTSGETDEQTMRELFGSLGAG